MRRTSPPAAGAAPFTMTTPSSAPCAARCGGSRCPCNPRRTPSRSAKSVEEQRREKVGTRWGRGRPKGERRSKAQGAQETQRPQARYRAHPGGPARARDLRVVVAYVLPTLPQRDGHVRSGRAAPPRAGLLVRSELAHHIQPGRSHPGTLRDPRRPTGRGIVPGGMSSISAVQPAQPFGLRLSARQPGPAKPKAEMLTSEGVSLSGLTS
jgi:hypothetical protein